MRSTKPAVVKLTTRPPKSQNRKVRARTKGEIEFVLGDATCPAGKGTKVVAHIINDKAKTWGGRGFAYALRKRWPEVHQAFSNWARNTSNCQELGVVHLASADAELKVCSMIAQHGYGPSVAPRIRYDALGICLQQLREYALTESISIVHMPRIGCGAAGGEWTVVAELLREHLLDFGVSILVYDLEIKGQR